MAKIKRKGCFAKPGVNKNPAAPIVFEAVMAYVLDSIPIQQTIAECKDPHKFISVRTVKGGAAKDDEYLGKAVRWYYGNRTSTAINYISNGNQVAKTMGAMPMMDMLPSLPDDLDYNWYIEEAYETAKLVGYHGWL